MNRHDEDEIGACRDCLEGKPCDCPCADCKEKHGSPKEILAALFTHLGLTTVLDGKVLTEAIDALITERVQAYPGPNNPRR